MRNDSYEQRALFLVMWFGAPSAQCKALFPEWTAARYKLKTGSVEETLWLLDFGRDALKMRDAPNA